MLVKRTIESYDLDKCLIEWEYIQFRLGKALWKDELGFKGQTCLQHSNKSDDDSYIDGSTIADEFRGNATKAELDYTILNEIYEGTVFSDMIRDVNGVRARIFIRKKNTTYSVHKDNSPRYYLALITNPNAYFIFPTLNEIVHIPADGYLYEVDTTKPHSFVNCGKTSTDLVISKRGSP
jgi:hypothetical protein